jgi:hypothetical protein
MLTAKGGRKWKESYRKYSQSNLRLLGVSGAVGGLHLEVKALYLVR